MGQSWGGGERAMATIVDPGGVVVSGFAARGASDGERQVRERGHIQEDERSLQRRTTTDTGAAGAAVGCTPPYHEQSQADARRGYRGQD